MKHLLSFAALVTLVLSLSSCYSNVNGLQLSVKASMHRAARLADQKKNKSPSISRRKLSTQVVDKYSTPREFADVRWNAHLMEGLGRLGIRTPSPVQLGALPYLVTGESCVLHSETGSGKTLAYLLPLLQSLVGPSGDLLHSPDLPAAQTYFDCVRLHNSGDDGPAVRALIVVPSKELALQIASDINTVTNCDKDFNQLVHFCLSTSLLGLDSIQSSIVIGTPVKLIDCIRHSSREAMERVQTLVLDEADRVLFVPGKYAGRKYPNSIASTLPGPGEELVMRFAQFNEEKMGQSSSTRPCQLIAASATVGRPFRRRLSNLWYRINERIVDDSYLAEDDVSSEPFRELRVIQTTNLRDPLERGVMAWIDSTSDSRDTVAGSNGSNRSSDSSSNNDIDNSHNIVGSDGDGVNLTVEQHHSESLVSGEKEFPTANVARRAVSIPAKINHVLVLAEDQSDSLNKKVVLAKTIWKNICESSSGPTRGLLFVPRVSDVSEVSGMLKFWGITEAIDLQAALGTESKSQEQQQHEQQQLQLQRQEDDDVGPLQLHQPASISTSFNESSLFVSSAMSCRGLHIAGMGPVILTFTPTSLDEYVHLAGRTGRLRPEPRRDNDNDAARGTLKANSVRPGRGPAKQHRAGYPNQPEIRRSNRSSREGEGGEGLNEVITIVDQAGMKKMLRWQKALGVKFTLLRESESDK